MQRSYNPALMRADCTIMAVAALAAEVAAGNDWHKVGSTRDAGRAHAAGDRVAACTYAGHTQPGREPTDRQAGHAGREAVARRRSSRRGPGVRSRRRRSRPASCAIASCCARRANTCAPIETDQASALLKQVGTTLPTRGFRAARRWSRRNSHLQQQKPDKALAELDRIPQPMPREDVVRSAGAARARAVCAESSGGRRHDRARARARAEQPGRSARESAADLAGPAAERSGQRGFHGAARRERDASPAGSISAARR